MEDSTSLLMWSHYADSHTGVCIEYDFSLGTEFLQACIAKHSIWSYVNEWRTIYNNFKAGLQDAPPVKAIYIGAMLDDSSKINELTKIARTLKCKLYKMELSQLQYEIYPVEILL